MISGSSLTWRWLLMNYEMYIIIIIILFVLKVQSIYSYICWCIMATTDVKTCYICLVYKLVSLQRGIRLMLISNANTVSFLECYSCSGFVRIWVDDVDKYGTSLQVEVVLQICGQFSWYLILVCWYYQKKDFIAHLGEFHCRRQFVIEIDNLHC